MLPWLRGCLSNYFNLWNILFTLLCNLKNNHMLKYPKEIWLYKWKIWKLLALNNFPRAILSVRMTLGPDTLTHYLWVLPLSNRFLSFQAEVSVLLCIRLSFNILYLGQAYVSLLHLVLRSVLCLSSPDIPQKREFPMKFSFHLFFFLIPSCIIISGLVCPFLDT